MFLQSVTGWPHHISYVVIRFFLIDSSDYIKYFFYLLCIILWNLWESLESIQPIYRIVLKTMQIPGLLNDYES